MSHKSAPPTVSTIGIDLGKNSFHLVGLDQRGAIVLQLKCSRAQLERRLANIPCCLIGMEACSGAHYIARQLAALGHDVRLLPAQYVKPFLKGHKNTTAMPKRLRKPCSGQPCTSLCHVRSARARQNGGGRWEASLRDFRHEASDKLLVHNKERLGPAIFSLQTRNCASPKSPALGAPCSSTIRSRSP
jgi:hypothetical protein